MSLEAITIPPANGQPAKGLVVLLHGWGANHEDVMAAAEYLDLSEYHLVFPNGPLAHPYNAIGRMWYAFPTEYRFMGTPEFSDRPDLANSRNLLIDFLKTQTESLGIPLSRTILGGFSQGGAMTLDIGVQLPVAGLMVLSGYLHAPLKPQVSNIAPTLIIHGRQDSVVPLQSAQQVKTTLEGLNVDVQYHEFNMGHEIQPAVLTEVQTFVKKHLPNH